MLDEQAQAARASLLRRWTRARLPLPTDGAHRWCSVVNFGVLSPKGAHQL